MGQEEANIAKPKFLLHRTSYLIDPRLEEFKNTLPSYFSAAAEKIVNQITNMMNQIPPQPLEQYLTNAIDNRFVHHSSESIKKLQQEFHVQTQQWYDLSTQERFLNILNIFGKQYRIQNQIDLQYKRLQAKSVIDGISAYQSLRTRIQGGPKLTMSEQLITRMLLGYYLKQIKIYANSGQKHITRFHQQTGRQLCLMIVKGYLTLIELYSLFYQFVYIDKHPNSVQKNLKKINQSYHSQCLKTQYSINVEKKKMDKMKMATRLYLDQLYLSCIREAEDPEIKNSDDSLRPIKMFPISRVKDKPRT